MASGGLLYCPTMRLRLPTRGLQWNFEHNDGRLVHKCMHYFPIYEQTLRRFRGRPITMLEIGVSHGGSLQMWRRYFGRRSTIVGIDINPRVAALAGPGIDIHVGDQSDPVFLARLGEQYGPFDIVLDDGSHQPAHQIASVEHLWPYLADGGVYIVEDLCTNYWEEYGGGLGRPDTFMAWTQARVDDMHAWHSREEGFEVNEWTRTIAAVHEYDSIVVLDKQHRTAPYSRMSGRASFDDVYGTPIGALADDDYRAQLASLNRPVARARRALRDPIGTVRRAATRLRRR
jgi:cephalosporin hydroxylase